MSITISQRTYVDIEVSLKCAECGAKLEGEFDGDDVIEVLPHNCPAVTGFYTAAVAHDFRKKFGDEAVDWLELQKMLFEK